MGAGAVRRNFHGSQTLPQGLPTGRSQCSFAADRRRHLRGLRRGLIYAVAQFRRLNAVVYQDYYIVLMEALSKATIQLLEEYPIYRL